MGNRTLGRQHLQWVYPLFCAYLWFSQLLPVEAARAHQSGDNRVREAVKQAVALAHPNVQQLSISDRNDLDEELSQIAEKATRPVSFYSFYDIDSQSDDGSLWVVVSGDSPMGSDELYSFETSDGVEQSARKFNRLLSHLALSIRDENAPRIVRFFLGRRFHLAFSRR